VTFRHREHNTLPVVSLAAFIVLAAVAASALCTGEPGGAASAQGGGLRFAVIGDYGYEGDPAAEVAALVRSWAPDLVITTGDNNYPDGAASTIDRNIGRHYAPFIGQYKGAHGQGSDRNRFFPSLGNHDWETAGARPYLDYFTLPGNERYYDFVAGPVHFFALDSDAREPDGITADSRQASWLRGALARTNSAWRLVYMHHPPYSSGDHGSTPETQWPYEDWGATAVMAGHDHSYERLQVGGISYFVNGLGGAPTYDFQEVIAGSRSRVTGKHGAMLVEARLSVIKYQFYTTDGALADSFRQCREWKWQPAGEGCLVGAWGGRAR
jgi:tartrate-resistant acid phosphatase type 5